MCFFQVPGSSWGPQIQVVCPLVSHPPGERPRDAPTTSATCRVCRRCVGLSQVTGNEAQKEAPAGLNAWDWPVEDGVGRRLPEVAVS